MCVLNVAVLLFLVSSAASQLQQTEIYDYCDAKLNLCEITTDHTMCKYPVSNGNVIN